MKSNWDEDSLFELVRSSVAHELSSGSREPGNDDDLLKSGLLDSMGWVGVLSALEKALGVRSFGEAWPSDAPQSIVAITKYAREALARVETTPVPAGVQGASLSSGQAVVSGWGSALGSLKIEANEVEAQFALPAGTISARAGIRSVRRAAEGEDELTLGQAAAMQALEAADFDPGELDLLVCTSTTFLELPPFAAALHNRLLLPESCTALDVGGACVGFVNALATAKNFLADGGRRAALVVASEVHSRRLATSTQAGEFRGLFGDGACAFLLRASVQGSAEARRFRVGEFISGCSGPISSALLLSLQSDGTVRVDFKGETLGMGAVATLNDVITKLERFSGASRSEVECFAFHEPNPRLAAVLGQRANISTERFARTAETTGNLGSVTCGVNLCTALNRAQGEDSRGGRRVIFLAAVGPGVLWSGTYLENSNEQKQLPNGPDS
jgi:3-oxoacyl-[acyl-carrier-protein] synthase III